MVVQTTFRFGELEAILADLNEIPSVQRTSFQAKLKDIQRLGLLRMDELPRGKAAAYGLRELVLFAIAVEMCQLGLSTKRAVEVMLEDEYPLWMAVMMGAEAIVGVPEVFNPGPSESGGDPNQEMWGFSPEWNDSKWTDPLSMFLYFDPSVLAPWTEYAGGRRGQDPASATFFYAGSGVVAENISRWTTGPTRRLALINVTKLVFDMSAYLGGAQDGLVICKSFIQAAQNYVYRGDFDLDGWLANFAKAKGMMVAARPDRSKPWWVPLEALLDRADPLNRYITLVEQLTPVGEPDYIKDAQRPDMIIRLPGQRELMVDAKIVPSADIPQRSIEWRLEELAEKPYRHPFADKTEYIVLYVPDETFFANAVAIDPAIIDRAMRQKVLISTPSILRNMLAEVDTAWTKYREEFPDLGEDEWRDLPQEQHRWLNSEYQLPVSLQNSPPVQQTTPNPPKQWPQPDDIGEKTGKRFRDMTAVEMALEMGAWDNVDVEPAESNKKRRSKNGDR